MVFDNINVFKWFISFEIKMFGKKKVYLTHHSGEENTGFLKFDWGRSPLFGLRRLEVSLRDDLKYGFLTINRVGKDSKGCFFVLYDRDNRDNDIKPGPEPYFSYLLSIGEPGELEDVTIINNDRPVLKKAGCNFHEYSLKSHEGVLVVPCHQTFPFTNCYGGEVETLENYDIVTK